MSIETLKSVLGVIERVLVPLVLGFLVYTTQMAQVRISRAQTELSKQQATLAATQGQQGFNVDCIKLFFNDICGQDVEKRQRMALALLTLLNDSLAKPLCQAVSENAGFSRELVDDARSMQAGILDRELARCKVVVYCIRGNPVYEADAQAIYDSLSKAVTAESIIVRKVTWEWLAGHGYSDGYEIRYEAPTETNIAQSLKSALEPRFPGKEFRLEPVAGRTPRFISIFVAGRDAAATGRSSLARPVSK